MAFTAAQFSRFRRQIDVSLRELYPADLIIGGIPVTASGPGGRMVTEYMDGGESASFRFPFRIPKDQLTTMPEVGMSADWRLSDTQTLALEVIDMAIRPGDDCWSITCKNRRV
jgi:hypothetical protein